MARINIEDSLWADFNFVSLKKKLGEDRAIGQLVRLWKLAQIYWAGSEQKPIPKDVFELHKFSKYILQFGWAAVDETGGVQVRGRDKHFAWLKQLRHSSMKGGNSTKSKYLAQPKGPFLDSALTLPLTLNKLQEQPAPEKGINHVKAFEARFSPKVEEFQNGIRQALGILNNKPPEQVVIPKSIIQKIPFFVAHFEEYDAFKTWVNSLISVKRDHPERYFLGALLRESGLLTNSAPAMRSK